MFIKIYLENLKMNLEVVVSKLYFFLILAIDIDYFLNIFFIIVL